MATAQVNLMMCVKSIVQGVSASAKYFAISTKVHTLAIKARPIFVASHLSTPSQQCGLDAEGSESNLHHLNGRCLSVLMLVLVCVHGVAQSPGEETDHGRGDDELKTPEGEEDHETPFCAVELGLCPMVSQH